jgi:predicted alpha/beta superfamily hydrolase
MKPKYTKEPPAFVSHSRETGTDYRIYVSAPGPGAHPGPWPAVVLMDGDFLFDPAVKAYRALATSGNAPPAAIVGVGYGSGFGQPGNFRGRDYTPTASTDEPSSGGADRFIDYLGGSLWPELARRYPLRESGRIIAGHSLGSLVVLHSLFRKKPFFDHALAGAPSIWWDNRSILGLISRLRDQQSRLPGRLYLGVGSEETPSMIGDVALLQKQLRDRPFSGLEVREETFAGRDHYDSAPEIMTGGLSYLFG